MNRMPAVPVALYVLIALVKISSGPRDLAEIFDQRRSRSAQSIPKIETSTISMERQKRRVVSAAEIVRLRRYLNVRFNTSRRIRERWLTCSRRG